MQDMELLLEELVDDHDLQWYEVLYLILGWLTVHRPAAQEEYQEDGSKPIFFYGHKEKLK